MDFPTELFRPKKDGYAKSRGGSSAFLYIACGGCDKPTMVYQKDGPGKLKRFYADRIVWPPELVKAQLGLTKDTIKSAGSLACDSCGTVIANPTIYRPEDRPAYAAVPGTIHAYRSAVQAEARLSQQPDVGLQSLCEMQPNSIPQSIIKTQNS